MFIRNDIDVSYVRLFNASPDAPPIDIYINGELTFKNLSFKNFSEYIQLPIGNYKIEVFSAGQKLNIVLEENIQVLEKQVITIAAVGSFEDLQLIPYIEGSTEDLLVDESRLRIINLSPDAPGMDMLIDERLVFKDVKFMDATDYVQIPSDQYNVSINISDTDDEILNLKVELKSQKVYTIYIVGNSPKLSVIQSLDGSTFIRFK